MVLPPSTGPVAVGDDAGGDPGVRGRLAVGLLGRGGRGLRRSRAPGLRVLRRPHVSDQCQSRGARPLRHPRRGRHQRRVLGHHHGLVRRGPGDAGRRIDHPARSPLRAELRRSGPAARPGPRRSRRAAVRVAGGPAGIGSIRSRRDRRRRVGDRPRHRGLDPGPDRGRRRDEHGDGIRRTPRHRHQPPGLRLRPPASPPPDRRSPAPTRSAPSPPTRAPGQTPRSGVGPSPWPPARPSVRSTR